MQNNFSRRNFLKTGALALSGVALARRNMLPFAGEYANVKHLGIQLWSVREDMKKDPAGTLAAIAKMGYKEVEGFGYDNGKLFGISAADFSKMLQTNGLSMPTFHHSFTLKDLDTTTGKLNDDAKQRLTEVTSLGVRYVINPWMEQNERDKIADLVKVYAAAGRQCKKLGVRFGYHNHNFEFDMKGPDGRMLYEWLLAEVPANYMTMQMDLYWTVFAKNNPVDWFKKYPGRFELCHVKDMAKSEKHETIEVGDGQIDFTEIFKHRAEAGLKRYIIELEDYKTTPMAGIDRARKGFMNIKFS